MSDHPSNGTNNEEICVDKPKLGDAMTEPDSVQTPDTGTKVPVQVNFGRPRKHPYKPGKYKCDYCDVMCSKPSVLKKHLRAHTNERPYPCSICKRSFKTKSNLSKHMKSKSHSSKIPSNKEKAFLMLQALSGVESESTKTIVESNTNNIEYDCVEKCATIDNSPATSGDDRSVASEDGSTEESGKKSEVTDRSQNKLADLQDNEPSSCSGMLTINSESGPITVEVEIKLETMKQLQHGLTNMTMKKYSPSSPSSSLLSRNDADVRAAESILHMANQRPSPDVCQLATESRESPANFEHKLIAPKEELRRMESTQSPDTLFTSNMRYIGVTQSSTKPSKPTSLSFNSKSMSRNRGASKSIPNEDQRKLKKCLMESLLKKMQKKTEKSSKQDDLANVSGAINYCSGNSVTESDADSTPTSSSSVIGSLVPQKNTFNHNTNTNTSIYKLNTLISDSKSPSYFALSSSSPKPTMVLQRAVPSNSLASHGQTSSNQAIILLSSFHDPKQNPQRINSPVTGSSLKVDSTTDVYSKPSNNSQIQNPQRACNVTTQTLVTSANMTSLSQQSIKEESIIPHKEDPVSPDNALSTNDSENPSNMLPTSNQTTHESDTGSSPRLCIVEDHVDSTVPANKKSTDSDEEIDVVNTDSDEEDTNMKRISDRSGSLSINKKRKGVRDFDVDLSECESKKMKEMEKAVTPHAPNINAKDLVQDCPLNLSANRQPIIPSCSQTPQKSGSVLENIYRPIVTSANTAESNIAALTNTNPAHPHSLGEASIIDVSVSSNGHHLDYPIFEDKVRCEVCSQLIEPSKLQLHKSMHIYTEGKDQQSPSHNLAKFGSESTVPKLAFNKPRTYRCVVCSIGFRVMGHLSKHHKSKTHLQGLVNSGLLSKALNAKIEESKVPIGEVIDQKTGNIIPDVLSRYLSDWSQPSNDSDSG